MHNSEDDIPCGDEGDKVQQREKPPKLLASLPPEFPQEADEDFNRHTLRYKRGKTLTCALSPQSCIKTEGEFCLTPCRLTTDDLVVRYGLHSVQGRRPEMEDDHKCIHGGRADPVTPSCPGRAWVDEKPPYGADDNSYAPPADTSFFGVYDGHAGTAAAHFLRKNLHRIVLCHPALREAPELAVRESIAQAEQSFIEYATEQRLDAGSTLAVVLIIGTQLIAANVGDSEVVLNRDGKPLALSTVHNMMKNPAEEERVRACGGRVHHRRLGHPNFNPQFFSIAVTRSIGDLFFKTGQLQPGQCSGLIADADTTSVMITPEDRFLIVGCDGLWDVMTHQQAIDFVSAALQEGKTCQAVCEALVAQALTLGSMDNITALVVTLK